MTIRDDARQEAERRWPEYLQAAKRDWLRGAFEDGAVWAREQDTREPSEAEVEAGMKAAWIARNAEDPEWAERVWPEMTAPDDWSHEALDLEAEVRAALLAAQEVRRERPHD